MYKLPHLQNKNQKIYKGRQYHNQRPKQEEGRPTLQDMVMEHITKSDERFKCLESTTSNFVTLMSPRTPNTLPCQTEANPKNEEVNVVSARSGKLW